MASLIFHTRPGSVVRSGDWKLYHNFEDGGIELYSLTDDCSESKNLESSNSKMELQFQPLKNPAYDEGFEKKAIETVLGL